MLLDTSNSMNEGIDHAGRGAQHEVPLYESGNNRLSAALDELAWSHSASNLAHHPHRRQRAVHAGPPQTSVPSAAADKGIIVNAIHFGTYDEGAASGWKTSALIAGGGYNAIDQSLAALHIAAKGVARQQLRAGRLNAARAPFVADARAKAVAAEENMQQAVVARVLRDQAACRGIELQ
jgi:hypothetical protein